MASSPSAECHAWNRMKSEDRNHYLRDSKVQGLVAKFKMCSFLKGKRKQRTPPPSPRPQSHPPASIPLNIAHYTRISYSPFTPNLAVTGGKKTDFHMLSVFLRVQITIHAMKKMLYNPNSMGTNWFSYIHYLVQFLIGLYDQNLMEVFGNV